MWKVLSDTGAFDEVRADMNILVIGLGSMGKRRIRLIQELYPDFVLCGVDAREDRRREASEKLHIPCMESIQCARKTFEIDIAFVCTAPLSHSQIITECLQNKWDVFTELNLVSDGYETNMELARKNGCKLFLSSTFLYREEIRYIRNRVNNQQKWNYIYHIGQYLPDWHPWENYNDFFVGNRRTNGCREIMAIELPWLISTFGNVAAAHVIADQMTGLNIDYCDNYMIQIEHVNGNKGTLIVDIVSPVAVRRLEIYGEHKYMAWNGTSDSLCEYNADADSLEQVKLSETAVHSDGYRAFVVENAYKNEIIEFMEVVLKNKEPSYGFLQDLEILKLIDTLEGQGQGIQ